jgi:hypothetical protein
VSARASLLPAIRSRRLRRAELRLADAKHNLRKWGFANTPSEDDRERRRIEKLRAKVLRLGGDA